MRRPGVLSRWLAALAMVVIAFDVAPPGRAAPAAAQARAAADVRWPDDFPDPFVMLHEGVYYAYGTSPGAGGHLIPVLVSRDLADWSSLGSALDRAPSWVNSPDLWAPAVARLGGRWVMYFSARHFATGHHCLAMATSAYPAGPFTPTADPLLCDEGRLDAIDPHPFTDAAGANWLMWRSRGGPGDATPTIWSQRLNNEGTALVGEPHVLLRRALAWENPVIEAPSPIAWGGRVLLFYSGGTFVDERYAIGAADCATPAGPCTRLSDNPLLSSATDAAGPGGQTAFFDASGRLRLAFHAWTPPRVGAHRDGHRTLRVGHVLHTRWGMRVEDGAFGWLDSVTAVPGGVRVAGWALDPASAGPLAITVQADAGPALHALATLHRPDVAAAFGRADGSFGFDLVIPVSTPVRSVCVRSPPRTTPLTCRPATAP